MNDLKPYIFAAVLFAGAYYLGKSSNSTPEIPPLPAELVLKGQFIGPTASQDAAMLSALCDELAVEIEEDGQKSQPRLTTGLQLEELRTAAREGRMRGESLAARQPHARKLIGDYMTQKLGVDPGEIKNRADWVAAFRTIAKACADAAK